MPTRGGPSRSSQPHKEPGRSSGIEALDDHTSSVPLVKIRSLRKSYSGRVVLEIDELEVARGELVLLCGPNGAGKSTLAKILAGTEAPDAGSIVIDGAAIEPGCAAESRRCGIRLVPQEPVVVGSLTGFQNLALQLEKSPHRPRGRGQFWHWVGEESQRALRELGMEEFDLSTPLASAPRDSARILCLVAAVAARPRLAILDETVGALDSRSLDALFELLERRAAEGASAMVITHHAEEIRPRCTRVLRLEHGVVVDDRPRGPRPANQGRFVRVGKSSSESGNRRRPPQACRPLLEVTGPELTAVWDHREGVEPLEDGASLLGADSSDPAASPGLVLFSGEVLGVIGDSSRVLFEALSHPNRCNDGRLVVRVHGSLFAVPADYDALAIFPDLSIEENLRLTRSAPTEPRRPPEIASELPSQPSETASFRRWLHHLDFRHPPTTKAGELSGGNRQKLAILRGLRALPDVLVLQEPFYSLDSDSSSGLGEALRNFASGGRGVLVTSDDTSALRATCTRVLRLTAPPTPIGHLDRLPR